MQNREENKKEFIQNITGVTCIYVPVSNVYNAVQWYEKILGCTLRKGDKMVPDMTAAIMRFPDPDGEPYPAKTGTVPALFLIQSRQDSGRYGFTLDNGKRHAVGCFITPHIRKMYNHFRDNGVTIVSEIPENDPLAPINFRFRDLDGNEWEIWQPY
jgi:catechol 2,3-dioxygenase-like lactoylglutathione lyase family enzyme